MSFCRSVFEKAPAESVVIMDNIAFHHSRAVLDEATRHGIHILFTPPYSPECNPVEHYFSTLKHSMRALLLEESMRGMTTCAMTGETFCEKVDSLIEWVSCGHPFENYFTAREREVNAPVAIRV